MEIDYEWQFRCLVQSLQLLASDYDEQISSLPDFVVVADEVALVFGDEYVLTDGLLEHGLITESQKGKLSSLDSQLSEMSDDKTLWSRDALRESMRWKEIRRFSKEILASFGIKKEIPNLSWITYIKGKNSRPKELNS